MIPDYATVLADPLQRKAQKEIRCSCDTSALMTTATRAIARRVYETQGRRAGHALEPNFLLPFGLTPRLNAFTKVYIACVYACGGSTVRNDAQTVSARSGTLDSRLALV